MNAPIKPNMRIVFHPALEGNKKAYWLDVGGTSMFISYCTIMAFRGTLGGEHVRYRRADGRSNTTRKHMGQCGVGRWEPLDDSSFNDTLEATLLDGIHPLLSTVKELSS